MSESTTNTVPDDGEAFDVSPMTAKRAEAIIAAQSAPRLLIVREIELMAGVLKLASQMAGGFVRRHPKGCQCEDREWCQQEFLAMQAIRYGCRMMFNDVMSVGGVEPTLGRDSFGDDLCHLASLSDRLDAAAARLSDPVPTAVIATPAGKGGAD